MSVMLPIGDTQVGGSIGDSSYDKSLTLGAGIAKRTAIAAKLADSYTATPEKVIGVLSLDPAFSTQLLDLDHPVCDAGLLDYATFIFQLAATTYGIVTTLIVWIHNAQLKTATYHIQIQQLLAVLTYNRGTWSIAALGAFSPWASLKVLYLTTAIAVAIEVTFTLRGFLIGWQMSLTPDIYRTFMILPWVLPAAEATTMACGMYHTAGRLLRNFSGSTAGVLAMTCNLRYISHKTIIVVLPVIWLAFGPLLIIGVALATHFGLLDCIVYQNNVC